VLLSNDIKLRMLTQMFEN